MCPSKSDRLLGEDGLPPSVMTFGGRFGYLDDAETPNTAVSIFNCRKAPLLFEIRGLPMKSGMKAMDAYREIRVGVIIHCEGGSVQISSNGTCAIYDRKDRKIVQYQDGGLESHSANFAEAMRSRKQSNIYGRIEDCHTSTNLCHLANISFLAGVEKTDAELVETIKASPNLMEAHGRMTEHLIANGVRIDTTKIVGGPVLEIDNINERIVGGNQSITDKANSSIIMKRIGREGFTIPEFSRTHSSTT